MPHSVNTHVIKASDRPGTSSASTLQASRLERPTIQPPRPHNVLLVLVMPDVQPPLLPPFGSHRPGPIVLPNHSQALPFLRGLPGYSFGSPPHDRNRPLSARDLAQSRFEIQQQQLAIAMENGQKAMKQMIESATGLKY